MAAKFTGLGREGYGKGLHGSHQFQGQKPQPQTGGGMPNKPQAGGMQPPMQRQPMQQQPLSPILPNGQPRQPGDPNQYTMGPNGQMTGTLMGWPGMQPYAPSGGAGAGGGLDGHTIAEILGRLGQQPPRSSTLSPGIGLDGRPLGSGQPMPQPGSQPQPAAPWRDVPMGRSGRVPVNPRATNPRPDLQQAGAGTQPVPGQNPNAKVPPLDPRFPQGQVMIPKAPRYGQG